MKNYLPILTLLCCLFSINAYAQLPGAQLIPTGTTHYVTTSNFEPQGYEVEDNAHLVFNVPSTYDFDPGASIMVAPVGFVSIESLINLTCLSGYWNGIIVDGFDVAPGLSSIPAGLPGDVAVYAGGQSEIRRATAGVRFLDYNPNAAVNTRCRAIQALNLDFIDCKYYGIYIANSNDQPNQSRLQSCRFSSTSGSLVEHLFAKRTYQINVRTCFFDCEPHQIGIHLAEADIICHNAVFTGYKFGVLQELSSAADYSVITSNGFSTSVSNGVAFESTQSEDLILFDNRILGGYDGIKLSNAVAAEIESNSITVDHFGIAIKSCVNNKIERNEVFPGAIIGINCFDSDHTVFDQNIVNENYIGIRVDESEGCFILRNTVTGSGVGVSHSLIELINTGAPQTLVEQNRLSTASYHLYCLSDNSGVETCANVFMGDAKHGVSVWSGPGIPDQGDGIIGSENDMSGLTLVGAPSYYIFNISTNAALDFYATTLTMGGGPFLGGNELPALIPCGGGAKTVANQEAVESAQISVYPNPSADGRFTLIFDAETVVRQVRVIDLAGRVVFDQRVNMASGNLPIDLSGNAQGVYTVQVQTANGIQTEKLIIK